MTSDFMKAQRGEKAVEQGFEASRHWFIRSKSTHLYNMKVQGDNNAATEAAASFQTLSAEGIAFLALGFLSCTAFSNVSSRRWNSEPHTH